MSEPVELSPLALKDTPLPEAGPRSDKDAHGQVLVIGGSEELPGAAVLVGTAALRAGAGKLRFLACEAYASLLGLAVPEARVFRAPALAGEVSAAAVEGLGERLESADAVVVGPGMLDEQAGGETARALLQAVPRARFVIDAAAMTGLRSTPSPARLFAGRAVLTPHLGEMAKMMDISEAAVRANARAVALEAARRFQAVVTLKDRQTHVASPDGRVWRNSSGASGLGVCGSGDVLAGIIGGLLAQGAGPETAAVWGVYLHAQAGRSLAAEVAPHGFLAREIAGRIPAERAAAEAA